MSMHWSGFPWMRFNLFFNLYINFFFKSFSSNASDALDKLRFLSVTEPSLLGDAGDLEIRIKPDADSGTITITYENFLRSFTVLHFVADWI